jgi:hypothetical protein
MSNVVETNGDRRMTVNLSVSCVLGFVYVYMYACMSALRALGYNLKVCKCIVDNFLLLLLVIHVEGVITTAAV